MSHMALLIAALAAAALTVSEVPVLAAQDFGIGTRVRLTLDEAGHARRLVGAVERVDPWTITILPDSAERGSFWVHRDRGDRGAAARSLIVVPRASLRCIEISAGRHARALTGLGIGLAVGGLAGLAVGLASGDDAASRNREFSSAIELTAAEKAIALTLLGGLIGLRVGSATRTDTWRPCGKEAPQVLAFFRPEPGGLALGVTLRR